jgi:hypothetical protein
LIITDLFSNLLLPTAIINRPERARTLRRMRILLDEAGFSQVGWQEIRGVATMANILLRSVVASKPTSKLDETRK